MCQEGGLWRKEGEGSVAEEDLGHRCGGRRDRRGVGVEWAAGKEEKLPPSQPLLLLTQCTTPFLRASSLWASLWASLLFCLVWFLFKKLHIVITYAGREVLSPCHA